MKGVRCQQTRLNLSSFAFLVALFFPVSGCKESSATAVPKLIKQLESPIDSERNAACQSLAYYGEAAGPATEALGRRLYDKNIGIRSSAAFALRKINTKDAEELINAYNRKRR